MRVLLIIPTFGYKYSYPFFMSNSDFPVGFAYLASALKNAGHEVFGSNPNNDPNYQSGYNMLYDKISRSIKESQPELIGIGGLCIDYKFLKDAITIIRSLEPDIPIVCGGGIINNDAEFIFKTLQPDFCIIGEGEEILVQLVHMLEAGQQDYEQIPNLGYWKQSSSRFTLQNFNYIDIDKINFPDYEPFEIRDMLDNYSLAAWHIYRYTRTNPRPMTIVTARGCPFNCTFCVHQNGPRYRARSIENIVQEIAFLYERWNFNILLIVDELFATNKLRLREFCSELINTRKTLGWDFDWLFQTHASANLGPEELQMAKEAGCYLFSYGIESASPKVLDSMNKRTKPSQIAKAIEIADAVGIGFGGNFIFGDVAETTETISETMDFFSQHCLDIRISLTDVKPYPGSKLFNYCMEKGIIHDKVKYYEHIDGHLYNMTSIPNWVWFPWIEKLFSLGSSSLWLKSANAFLCSKELEMANNPLVLHYGKSVIKVGIRCPHCANEVYYREGLWNINKKRSDSFFANLRYSLFDIIKRYHRERKSGIPIFYCFRNFIYRLLKHIVIKPISSLLVSRYSIFKSLKPLSAKNQNRLPFFVTGCPSCNKIFKVYIPEISFEG